ncbi:MAG: hypothetical protein QM622_10870 [Microbacterium sp.]
MSIGRAVIRPLKNSLDDMPVHVRQLAEMFRKHGVKQDAARGRVEGLDAAKVPDDLQKAWKTDSVWMPDDVVGAGKGNRPDPGDYLDEDYVKKHLERFKDGGTRFYRPSSLDTYGPGNAGTTFVFPTSEVDDLIAQAGGDPEKLGVLLGLGEDFFPADGVVTRADFTYDELQAGDLRIPSGNEGGADQEKWIPGGYLPEGLREAVFTTHPHATSADPSVGGTWGSFDGEFSLR